MAAPISDSEDDAESLDVELTTKQQTSSPGAIDVYSASVQQDAFASKVEAGDPEALKKLSTVAEKLQQKLLSEAQAIAEMLDADGSGDASTKLIEQVAEAMALRQVFPHMVAFLKHAETELPKGQRPKQGRYARKAAEFTREGEVSRTRLNSDLAIAREEMMHQKRGRTSCLAGWQMTSNTISLEDPARGNTLSSAGYAALEHIWPLFYPALSRPEPDSPLAIPQVLAFEGAVMLVLAFFNRAKGDGKSRLAWRQAAIESVNLIIGLMPEESNERTFIFGPASKLCHVKVKKKTELKVLDAEVELGEEEGARVELTHAGYAALNELIVKKTTADLDALEKKNG